VQFLSQFDGFHPPTQVPVTPAPPSYLDEFESYQPPEPSMTTGTGVTPPSQAPVTPASPSYLDEFEGYQARVPSMMTNTSSSSSYLSSFNSSVEMASQSQANKNMPPYDTTFTSPSALNKAGPNSVEDLNTIETSNNDVNQKGNMRGVSTNQNNPQDPSPKHQPKNGRFRKGASSDSDASSETSSKVQKDERYSSGGPEKESWLHGSLSWLFWMVGALAVLIVPVVFFSLSMKLYALLRPPSSSALTSSLIYR